MARVIRYLEDGVWKYASVKAVGDLEKLLTSSKTDIVSAINELIASGNALEVDVNNRFDGIEGAQNELVTITGNVQTELGKVQGDLLNKAEQMYVDEQVNKLVSKEAYEANYQKLEGELLDKVNIDKYNEEYSGLVGQINSKTEDIEKNMQEAINEVNGSIAMVQQVANNAKNDVVNLDSKVEQVKGDIVADIESEKIKSASTREELEKVKTDLQNSITETKSEFQVQSDKISSKVEKVEHDELAGKVTSQTTKVEQLSDQISHKVERSEYDELKGTVSLQGTQILQTKSNIELVAKKSEEVEGRVTSSETKIKQNENSINLKAEKTYVDESLDGKVNNTDFDSKVAEIKLTTDGISQEVTSTKAEVNTAKGNITTMKQDMSKIDQKADSIKQSVTSLETKTTAQGEKITSHESSINTMKGEISLKASKEDVAKDINTEIDKVKSEIKITTDGIVQEVSKTNTKLDNISVGGRNLALKTDGVFVADSPAESNYPQRYFSMSEDSIYLIRGKQITTSFKAKSKGFIKGTVNPWVGLEVSVTYVDGEQQYLGRRIENSLPADSDWTIYSYVFQVKDKEVKSVRAYSLIRDVKGHVELKEWKVEIGNVVTDYSVAPEDTNTAIGEVSQQVSKIEQKADSIELTVKSVQGNLETIGQKISTAETKISQNEKAIALKAEKTQMDDIGNRVSQNKSQIDIQAEQISQKVNSKDYENDVGVNKWVARRFNGNIGSNGTIPSFSHIKGKQPNETLEYNDNIKLQPFVGDYYIGHYFTNIYMKTAKTVTLNVTNDDGAVIYMNGAKMYEGTTRTTALSVPMTFRAGWNTVEILHYEHSGATEHVTLGVKLSTQVDKMTSVIGVGDKNETRLVEAETEIKQTSENIKLKAEKTVVENLGNKVTANEGSINIMKDEIKLLVKSEDFNKYTGRLEVAESTITQHTNQINQKVEKTEYNALNNIVNQQQTSINQLSDEIDLKATKSEYDGLNGRVADAETQINLNTEAINLRAKQTELDKTNGRLQTAESKLTVQANQISTKVTQEDVNKSIDDVTLGGSNMLNKSGQKLSALNGKDTNVNFSVSDKIKEFLGKQVTISFSVKATNLASNGTSSYWIGFEVEVTHTDNTKSYLSIRNNVVQEGTYDWTRLAKTHNVTNKPIASVKAYAMARAFTGSVEIKDIMLEAGNKASQHNISPEDSMEVESRVSNAETEIIQQAEEISLKANSNDVYKKTEADGKVSTAVTQAKSEIKLETDKISQNITNLTNTVTSQGNTISSHNTSITQMKDSINLKAEASKVYTKAEADGKISNAVAQAKSEIKIDTDKITQSVTNMQGNLDDLEDTVVAQGTQIQQTSNEVAINVVKKGNVMASVNASQEGVKILGKHLELTGAVTFNSLDPTMQGKVNAGTDANNKIDGLNISARNLILDSGTDHSTTGYLISTYTLSEDWIAGQEYTFVIKGTISAGQQFGVWMNGSANRVGYATETYVDGVTYVTFKALATTAGNERRLSLYNYPQNTTISTVDWVALYKGNKPLDHSPAPEDMEKRINEFSVRNRNHVLNSTFALGNTEWQGITNATTTKIVDIAGLEGYGIMKGLQITNPTAFITQGLKIEPFDKAKGYVSAFVNVKTLVTPKENPRVYLRFTYDQSGTEKMYYATAQQTTVTNGSWVRLITQFDTRNYTGILKDVKITMATNGVTTVDATFAGSLVNFGDVLADWSNAKEDIDKMVSDADKKAQDVTNRVDDMSSDNKLTPVEKVQLKKEWATMVSEKPSYEALANSYAVTTEKTDYINSYNALNTALNGTNGYLKDMQATSAINGATFRGIFDDYYDKKSKLIRKINETSKSIGDSANNKIDGMIIGGNQLVSGTEFLSASGWSRWGTYGKIGAYGIIAPIGRSLYVETKDDAGAPVAIPKGSTVGLQGNGRKFAVKKGQEYTLSMNVATSEFGDILDYMYLMYTVEGGNRRLGDIKVTDFPQVAPIYTGATVYYYKVKLTFKADRDDDNAYILIAGTTKRDLTGSNGYAWIRVNNLKIEEGNVATAWGLSQGDIDQIISDVDKKAEESKKAIADMSNDNKVTPVEKFQLKKEWATITAEKPQYESLSTTYGITTEKTNYVNAYNALNTAVTPIIASMTTTSDVNGATFRSTFDDYYDKKAQLIKKINEISRTLANDADKKAQESKNAIADMANDNKITPIEKQQLKKEWATITAEKPQYEALATTYGVTTERTNYVNAYNALNTFISPFLTNITVTSDINGATFRNTFDDYYDKFAQLIKKINELSRAIGTNADSKAQEAKNAIADMANDNKLTPLEKQQLKKEWATISAEKPQYEALSNTYGVTTEKTNYVNAYNALNNFITPLISNIAITSDVTGATFRATFDDYYDKKAQLIKKVNELARSIGTSADTKAQEAKNAIADMSSDSKITPVEKVQLAKEWAVMVAEKPKYEALSTTYGITTEKTNYVNAYNTLNTVLNGTGGILTSMTTTSAVTGSTFRGQFDDYYDKKSQIVKKINEVAKSLADGAQGTANTANGKADTANTAINTNKATWDRASNINSNGTFNSSKLSGQILDAQISSAVNWNGAKSLLDSWKSGTTMINGGMIATDSIFAQQIAIGDFTNLSQINEEKNPNGFPTAVVNSKKYFKMGNIAYAQLSVMVNTYVEFKVNDEYYIAFNGYRDSGITSLNANMRYYYSDNTWTNAGSVSIYPTTSDTRIAKNLKITVAPDEAKTLTQVKLFFEKDNGTTNGYYYVRDIEVRKRYTGELIVDGSIKAQQLDVNSLFAHTGFINSLKAVEIDASKITTGELRGIYVRTDGTNSFSYISGGSIASKSKIDATETWIDQGLVRVRDGAYQSTVSPDSLTISVLGKSGYGKVSYYSHATDLAQNNLNIWSVGKITLEPNGGDLILKGRPHIQKTDDQGVALNFPNTSSITFDQYGNITTPSSVGSGATWAVKDGDGTVRLLVPVGKGTSGAIELKAPYGGVDVYYQGYRFLQMWGDSVSRVIRFGADGGQFRWKNNRFEFTTYDDGAWAHLAGIWDTVSSRTYKKDIDKFTGSALDIINSSVPKQYRYTSQSEDERVSIGLIAEEAPWLIQGSDKKTVDTYGMTTLAWKAIQELSRQVRYLKEQLNNR